MNFGGLSQITDKLTVSSSSRETRVFRDSLAVASPVVELLWCLFIINKEFDHGVVIRIDRRKIEPAVFGTCHFGGSLSEALTVRILQPLTFTTKDREQLFKTLYTCCFSAK